MRLEKRWFGLLACMLLIVGCIRLIPTNEVATVQASTAPPVISIEESEAEHAANQTVDYQLVEVIKPVEDRVTVLECRAADAEGKLLEMAQSIVGVQQNVGKVADAVARVVEVQTETQKALLGMMQQSAAPPAESKPPEPQQPEPQQPKDILKSARNANEAIGLALKARVAKYHATGQWPSNAGPPPPRMVLRAFTASWCAPCKAWKAGPDAASIESDGIPIQLIDIDRDTPPGAPRPASVPYFELWADNQFVRHTGYLTYQRFKDMERAVLDAVRGAK